MPQQMDEQHYGESEGLFTKIRERIETSQLSKPLVEVKIPVQADFCDTLYISKAGDTLQQKSKVGKRKWILFLRYAAVFVISFGLSWVLHKFVTQSADTEVVAEAVVQYHEIGVPYGSKAKVKMPDNSTVWRCK